MDNIINKLISISFVTGFIDTDFHMCRGVQRSSDEYTELIELNCSAHPLGRVGTTDDCVHAISALASDRAGFITGADLTVDGGLSTVGPYSNLK